MIGKDISTPRGENLDEKVKELTEKLDRGIKRRRKEEKYWRHVEKFENMDQWNDGTGTYGPGTDDQVTVNKLGSYIRNYNAEVAYNNPLPKLTPKTSDGWEPIMVPIAGPGGQPQVDEMGQAMVKPVIPAKAREALLRSIIEAPMHHTTQTSGLLTKSGVIAYGVLKSLYKPIIETAPDPEGEQIIPINDGAMDFSGYETNKIDGSLIENDKGRLISRTEVPIWEDFQVRWVPYDNIVIDPDGGNYWDDHSWVAEEEVREFKAVKDDPLFKNTKDLRPSGKRSDDVDGQHFSTSGSDWSDPKEGDEDNEDLRVVRLFHVYDMVKQRYQVVADGHGEFLRDVSFVEMKISGHPYSDFRPNELTTGEFYPRPIGRDLAPINEHYNMARQMELRAMKNSTRKVFTRKGALSPQNLDDFASDEDMMVIETDIPKHQTLSDSIQPYTPPQVSPAIYTQAGKIAQDFSEVGGMTDEARGAATADTATQVNAMQAASSNRVAHDRKVLAETWRRAFKKLDDLVDANMTRERAVRVQGTDGEVFEALLDIDLIAGDFDVSVDFEDMAPVNTAAQSAGRVQIAQIAGQAPHLFMSEPLVKGWLEPFGIKDQNFIDALVQASQMQMQMLMMQNAQAPGPSPEADAPKNEADAISQTGAGTQTPRMSGAS